MDTNTKTEGRVTPWNKGKLLGQKPPLKLKEIWAIQFDRADTLGAGKHESACRNGI